MTLNFKKNITSNFSYLIIALLVLPVFFINVTDSHDWGGDFAQYISQAKNIVEGKPHYETGYIFNDNAHVLGPPAYPAGFPLLLAPVYLLSGNSIMAFSVYISLFLFLLGMLMFAFFKKYFNNLISIILVLIIIYNPGLLRFKMEIMSEIPFTFFLILSILFYQKKYSNIYLNGIIVGLLAAMLTSIRTIGIIFSLAIIFDFSISFLKNRKKPDKKILRLFTYRFVIIFITAVISHIILNILLFPMPPDSSVPYMSIFNFEIFRQTVLENLSYYIKVFQFFFSPYNKGWEFVSLILSSLVFSFILLGMINKFSRKFDTKDIIILLYLFVIMIYPYRGSGFRFLLPVLPLFMYYLVIGLKSVKLNFRFNNIILTLVLSAFVLIQYISGISNILKHQNRILPGPQEFPSVEAFNFIKENTPEKTIIVFSKPRVLALYTDRRSLSNERNETLIKMKNKFDEVGVDFYLIHNEISDDSIKKYINVNNEFIELVWNNKKFYLYKNIKK